MGSPLRRAVFAMAAGLALALSARAAAADPDAAIRALLGEDVLAWNRGDLDAFCSAYVEDAAFLTPTGVTHGRQAVLDRYRAKYKDKAGMGSLTLDVLETRELVPGKAASAIARWTLTWPDKPQASGFTLLVFRRTSEGWRIAEDASM